MESLLELNLENKMIVCIQQWLLTEGNNIIIPVPHFKHALWQISRL